MNPLQAVALGEESADLVVVGGRALVPGVGFRERDVAVRNGRIAALLRDATPVTGAGTDVIDATGQTVVPGFVDAHTHLDYQQAFERSFPHALAGGTTAVVTELTGIGTVFGAAGVKAFLAATADLPAAVFVALPPEPLFDTFEPAWADDAEREALSELVSHDRVVGVGEVDWIHAVGRDTPAEVLFGRAAEEGKPVSGHGAGCRGANLRAFASVIDNDHEAIDAEGIVERVENGIHAVGRAGTIRDDIGALGSASRRIDPSEVSLSTDGAWPRDLLEEGYMDRVVRRAIEEEIDPVDAVRMATRNAARHFGLDDRGELAPGAVADLVLLDDLERVAVDTVVAGGRVVVRDGGPTVGPRPHTYPEWILDTVDVRHDPDTFRVPGSVTVEGQVRAIEYAHGLVSRETTVEPRACGDELLAVPGDDILKATIQGYGPGAERAGYGRFTGFVAGLGLERGAVATSTTWEVPAVVTVGADDEAMSRALGRVVDQGGGWAVADDEVVATHPCRVAGTYADLPAEETADNLGEIERALRARGMTAENVFLAVATLTFPGVPALKLSFSGYADVLERRVVGLSPT